MKKIVDVPRNALIEANLDQSGLLIDARDYYLALCRALEQAERYVVVSGWQFDTGVRLLRGKDAQAARHPVALLDFLAWLCAARPELHIYILAWDFSFVYAREREQDQKEKFSAAHPRIHFEWDTHPSIYGSHHQKFVVVDGRVGFLGGIDLCDARWDDRAHLSDQPERVSVIGERCKPYHDVQACFTGPLVDSVVALYAERWERACGRALTLSAPSGAPPPPFDLHELCGGLMEPIVAKHAALSRTQVDSRAEPERIGEVLNLLVDAISSAQRLIYAETQYFTSRSVAKALLDRMADSLLPKLDIVVFMPRSADTGLEKIALGDTQEAVLNTLLAAARETGHELRLLYPASPSADGADLATFIHSKLLIVDDRLLLVGSPNFTERSVARDTEIAITWECSSEEDGLGGCIRNIRTRLLAEHSGLPAGEFELQHGLCRKIDLLIAGGGTRLRWRNVLEPGALGPIFAQIFDPGDAELSKAALSG